MPDLSEDLVAARAPGPRQPATPPRVLDEAALRASMAGALAARRPGEPLRLFSYGALMWERAKVPGAEARPAALPGFDRAWCLRDMHNRGTPEAPGLTLGVLPRPDARCEGLLFTLAAGNEEAALWSAWQQEMAPGFYRAEWVPVQPLPEGRMVRAIVFVADKAHPLWAGGLPEGEQAAILAHAAGAGGPAADYLRRAEAALRAEGMSDPLLARLSGRVAALLTSAAPSRQSRRA
jgi:cation transport protein ChaC